MITFLFQREITRKTYRQELWFLWSARRLMMLYISLNYLEQFSSYRATRLRDGWTQTDN